MSIRRHMRQGLAEPQAKMGFAASVSIQAEAVAHRIGRISRVVVGKKLSPSHFILLVVKGNVYWLPGICL